MDVLVESRKCIFCSVDYGHMKYEGTSMLKIHMYSMHAMHLYKFLNTDLKKGASDDDIREKMKNFVLFAKSNEQQKIDAEKRKEMKDSLRLGDLALGSSPLDDKKLSNYSPASPVYRPPTIRDFGIDRLLSLNNSSTVDDSLDMDISPPHSASPNIPPAAPHPVAFKFPVNVTFDSIPEPHYEVPYSKLAPREKLPLLPTPTTTDTTTPKPQSSKLPVKKYIKKKFNDFVEKKIDGFKTLPSIKVEPVEEGSKSSVASPIRERVKRSTGLLGPKWTMKRKEKRSPIGRRRCTPSPEREAFRGRGSYIKKATGYLSRKIHPSDAKRRDEVEKRRRADSESSEPPAKCSKKESTPLQDEQIQCHHFKRNCKRFGTRRCSGSRCLDVHPMCPEVGRCPGVKDRSCPFRHTQTMECYKCSGTEFPRPEIYACPHSKKRTPCRDFFNPAYDYGYCRFAKACSFRHSPCPDGPRCADIRCFQEHTKNYFCPSCRSIISKMK